MRPDALREAELFFHKQIPITRAMGVRVVAGDDDSFVVEAPVTLNHNHLQTGFGGSIHAVATLAGYGLLWLELRDATTHIVIAESTIRFLRPVMKTIRASCKCSGAAELDSFIQTLRTTGGARIRLVVSVEENGAIAAEFLGTFVVRKKSSELQPRSCAASNP